MQAMWQSRSRLDSARTVSESSEGCGLAVELEMSEDFSLAGSLKRRRHREDSAYMSQRDSLSGGPPETSSPEMEEEDQNGYVLPGDSPGRGNNNINHLTILISYHQNSPSKKMRKILHALTIFVVAYPVFKEIVGTFYSPLLQVVASYLLRELSYADLLLGKWMTFFMALFYF